MANKKDQLPPGVGIGNNYESQVDEFGSETENNNVDRFCTPTPTSEREWQLELQTMMGSLNEMTIKR